jgi:hypothetical protein
MAIFLPERKIGRHVFTFIRIARLQKFLLATSSLHSGMGMAASPLRARKSSALS